MVPYIIVGEGTREGRGGAPTLDPTATLLQAPVAVAAKPSTDGNMGMPRAGYPVPDPIDSGFMGEEGGGHALAPELSS